MSTTMAVEKPKRVLTIEDAERAKPSSNWHETSTPFFAVEHFPRYRIWNLWLMAGDGKKVGMLEGFKRKKDAMALADAMEPYAEKMERIVRLKVGDDERKALVVETNQAFLDAIHTINPKR